MSLPKTRRTLSDAPLKTNPYGMSLLHRKMKNNILHADLSNQKTLLPPGHRVHAWAPWVFPVTQNMKIVVVDYLSHKSGR